MGRLFIDHMGGEKLFSCAACEINLTNRKELISMCFTGATGRAYLFNKVINIKYSDVLDQFMLTGRHFVRFVSCKKCDTKLGWMYEFAMEKDQRYKEGKIVLERALIVERDGLKNEI